MRIHGHAREAGKQSEGSRKLRGIVQRIKKAITTTDPFFEFLSVETDIGGGGSGATSCAINDGVVFNDVEAAMVIKSAP